MKQTKEELLIKVAELEHSNEQYLLSDQLKRKEFAKAFSWHKQRPPYSGGYNEPPEPVLP